MVVTGGPVKKRFRSPGRGVWHWHHLLQAMPQAPRMVPRQPEMVLLRSMTMRTTGESLVCWVLSNIFMEPWRSIYWSLFIGDLWHILKRICCKCGLNQSQLKMVTSVDPRHQQFILWKDMAVKSPCPLNLHAVNKACSWLLLFFA